ncbi:MAG TPA: hypothetical protein VEY67_11310, partial [Candidatus Dormibacteraeota bacterium]|nr:hypothetical protein [Candidatus Dormibacteraeota bacterium]
PSPQLLLAAMGAVAVAVILPLSPLAAPLGFATLPPVFWVLLVGLVAAYLALVELVKRRVPFEG